VNGHGECEPLRYLIGPELGIKQRGVGHMKFFQELCQARADTLIRVARRFRQESAGAK
jgi:hypothetical protein